MHQAGLLPALRHVHNSPMEINKKIVVTYHTYMPPGYLVSSMRESERTIIVDLQGAKREQLDLTIERIFNEYSLNHIQVYLILPVTCQSDLIYLKQHKYSFNRIQQFKPHLDFDHGISEPYSGSIYQWICTIFDKFQLDLYQITRS
jgi:hypothetical protein